MLTLLLLACSTSNGPSNVPNPSEQSLAAIEKAEAVAVGIETESGSIAQTARKALQQELPDKDAADSIETTLKSLQENVKALEKHLNEAGEVLAFPNNRR
jgi:hypothetical protein